ncbi:heavy-metal-associated domain-containing protein [Aerosakkonemataceae cyanobacterium BLCC-F50]|uniref:Heavy-metal-associated domain-containing protein n=1 Tax=Floridaenema flaviceps BLCC-F50 TaxID=3153642 RepID=A0ABV4XQI5_9CYAN
MSLKLNVPTLTNSQEAQKLTDAIATVDPTAKVEVDVESKTVTVDSSDSNKPVASEESIKQAITATGHSLKE